jgi:hypothetical protein
MPGYWRIYFWAYLALTALSMLGAALRPADLMAIDWVDLAAFTPVALFAVGAQAFNRSVLPTNVWRGLLFASVFWKSIALGISLPKAIARGVDMNAKVGLGAAEVTIALALFMTAFLVGPPLVALYCKGYPDGDLGRIRLPSAKRDRRPPAKAKA